MSRPRVALRAQVGSALAVVLIAVPALQAPALAQSQAAPTPQPPLSGKRINELAAPAVRLIVVDYDAEVQVYAPEVDEDAAAELASDPDILDAVLAGADPSGLVVDALTADPGRFLQKVDTAETRQVQLQSVGSGFVVTPDGYVLTNAHVVDSGSDELKQGIVDTALQPLTQEIAAEAAAEFEGSLSQDQINRLQAVVVDFVAANMVVSSITTTVQAAEGTQVPGQDKQFKMSSAEVVTKGEGFPGKDIALLKIEGRDLPTLPLANDADVDTGESLYALGYPANVTFLADFKQSAQSTATLTNGVVSAKREVSGGYTAIQTDAAISGGNSGGPALDDQGQVVGLTTAGLVTDEGKTGGAYSFVVPVGVAREFLQRTNITPSESQATTLWRSALTDFDGQRFVGASGSLRRLDSVNPGRPDVQAKLRDSDANVAAGLDRTPEPDSGTSTSTLVLIVLIVLGVLGVLALAVLLALVQRRRRRSTPDQPRPVEYAGQHPQPDLGPAQPGQHPEPAPRQPAGPAGGGVAAHGFPIYPGQPGYPDNPPFPGYPVYPGQPGYPEPPQG